jgi:hypothetical protein
VLLDDPNQSASTLMVETNRGTYDCRMEDVERLDELIGRYMPIALSAEQDFDRALRAAYVVLELIDTQTTLLESYPKGTP